MDTLFKIYKVDEQEALRIQSEPNEPHQHAFEELVIGLAGQIEHFIDFKSKIYDAPFVSFVSKGKIHRVVPLIKDGQCDFWVLRFKSEFIPETTFNLYAYYHQAANLSYAPGRCFNRLNQVCQMIYDEMQQEHPELSIVRELLNSLFAMIEAERKNKLPINSSSIKIKTPPLRTSSLSWKRITTVRKALIIMRRSSLCRPAT